VSWRCLRPFTKSRTAHGRSHPRCLEGGTLPWPTEITRKVQENVSRLLLPCNRLNMLMIIGDFFMTSSSCQPRIGISRFPLRNAFFYIAHCVITAHCVLEMDAANPDIVDVHHRDGTYRLRPYRLTCSCLAKKSGRYSGYLLLAFWLEH